MMIVFSMCTTVGRGRGFVYKYNWDPSENENGKRTLERDRVRGIIYHEEDRFEAEKYTDKPDLARGQFP